MKKINKIPALILLAVLCVATACDKKDIITPTTSTNDVSLFAYDGLSLFYLWNKEMKDKKPSASDSDPAKYFQTLLNPVDVAHGWSWITDDVEALQAGFEGRSMDAFGFVPFILWTDESRTTLAGIVKYVYPNTPAANAGIKRGNIITLINGRQITKENYHTLLGAKQKTTFTVLDQNKKLRDIDIVPARFETDPVLYHNIYEIGDKKIGYLFYTEFIHNYNSSLYNVFQEFKRAGVTDLVVDLRYNHGGAVSSASYLASLIAPRQVVESSAVLSTMSFNDDINQFFDQSYKKAKESEKWRYERNDYFRYFLNKDYYDNGRLKYKKCPDPLGANLNLSKVYIIATNDSYSASELTTFCLKPYMNVVHIGSKTGGKYTASWTVHAFDKSLGQTVYDADKISSTRKAKLKNWAMQPIVARYTDKNGQDFIATDGLIPDYSVESQEADAFSWKPIGDEEDYLLAKAISLITGRAYAPAPRKSRRSSFVEPDFQPTSPREKIIKEAVILNNKTFTAEDMRELRTFLDTRR